MERGIKKCPICAATAEYTQGGLRNNTLGRFEDEYDDGIKGFCAIRFSCPNCKTFLLHLHTYHAIQAGKLDPKKILAFKIAQPEFKGCIPLESWLETQAK